MTISIQDVQMKIADLQTALLSNHPTMPGLLREIHTTLKSDPETVTLLTDAEVGTIIASLQSYTGAVISAKSQTAASAKKALKNLSASDL